MTCKAVSFENYFTERSFKLLKVLSFSFIEMFHESFEKQFDWNLLLRYTMKSTLN